MSIATSLAAATLAASGAKAMDASVAKWHNDADAALALYYDDGCASTFKNVVPTLNKHKVPGTFFLCCGWYEGNPKYLEDWIAQAKSEYIHIGNHTYTHGGGKTAEECTEGIAKNDAKLRELLRNNGDAISLAKASSIMAFATPGGVDWPSDRTPLHKFLDEHNNIDRGLVASERTWLVAGPVYTDAANVAREIEKTINAGGIQSILFHGVGGDWLTFDANEHEKVIERIAAWMAENKLWVAPVAEIHKYAKFRDNAKLAMKEAQGIEVVSFALECEVANATDAPVTVILKDPSFKDGEAFVVTITDSKASEPENLILGATAAGGALKFDVPKTKCVRDGVFTKTMLVKIAPGQARQSSPTVQ